MPGLVLPGPASLAVRTLCIGAAPSFLIDMVLRVTRDGPSSRAPEYIRNDKDFQRIVRHPVKSQRVVYEVAVLAST